MAGKKSCLRLVSVHLPEAYIKELERLVKEGRFPSRSEAIRAAVREFLIRELWRQRSRGVGVGLWQA